MPSRQYADWFEEWSFFDINGNSLEGSDLSSLFKDNSTESPSSVPEPTTTLGLLTLGVIGAVQKLLKKINQ